MYMMRNLCILVLFCVQTLVKGHQYEADQVYIRLSDRIDYEIDILKRKHERELQDIKEEILSKIESQINEKIVSKIDSLINEKLESKIESQINEKIVRKIESQINENIVSKIDSLINEKLESKIESQINEKIARKIESQINEKIDSKTELQINEKIDSKTESQKNEKIDAEVAIIKQAFKAEKKHVRTLQERTYSCTERLKAINDSVVRNEETDKENKDSLERQLRALEATQRNLYTNQVRNEEANTENKDSLERQLRDLGATQRHLSASQDTLEQEVEKLMDKQSSLDIKAGKNQDSLDQLLSKMVRRRVAFSAYLGSPTEKLPIGSTVVFDKVVYQEGNGYNPKDGVFTCPETGVYMFSIVIDNGNLQHVTKKAIAVKLQVDSVWKVLVISEEHHQYQDDQSSNLVILKVTQGQRVWVETYWNSDVIVWREYSTFSGVLLYN